MERGYFLPFLISFPVHIHIETCVWQDADRHGHRGGKANARQAHIRPNAHEIRHMTSTNTNRVQKGRPCWGGPGANHWETV